MKIKNKSIKYIILSTFIVAIFPIFLFGQFPGAVGTFGTTAIYKDSSIFVGWANGCVIERGFQDIADASLGYASLGAAIDGTGQTGLNGVVSFGDGGTSMLTFQFPIINQVGFDFAVFENAFNDSFLELAFVEVSSDGTNYFRFPATSNMQTDTQIGPFDNVGDATKINNLAGKYRAEYGTPFDLEELIDADGLDVNQITHIKIIDVVGSINPLYASYDLNNNPINDPYPTPFASCGFDLDAVGIIHQTNVNALAEIIEEEDFLIFPNPVHSNIHILDEKNNFSEIQVFNSSGILILTSAEKIMSIENMAAGIYFAQIKSKDGNTSYKKINKQ